MFILYQSNNLDILKKNILDIIKKNIINNIFLSKIFILVSNNNISLNLKIFLSENIGICANFKFLLIGDFIWKFCKKNISNLSKKYYFNKYNLVWIIFNILPKVINLKEFYSIKKYLKNDYNYNKLFNLSIKISNIFDEYLMYRIDWLYEWSNYKLIKNIDCLHQKWQSILWRKIIKYFINNFSYKWNKSNIYIRILKILRNKNFIFPKNFIDYICIFNISFIPPIYLNILYLISNYKNIYYFLFNPSYKFWYETFYFNNKENNIFNKNNLKKDLLIFNFYKNKNNNNSLLLSYGKSLSELLLLLLQFNIKEINYFLNIKKKSKLDIIKNNILNFKDVIINNKNKNFNKDDSIIINKSYGYLEEIINLKNFLLDLIINKNIVPSDIIVNVTNINKYYPYIKSVFSDLKYKRYLPYKILECNNIYENELLNIFLNLLNISNLEFNFIELLCFLKKKIIFKKFNINYEELKIIIYIIKNIGLNVNSKNDIFNFKKFNYLSWINSLKRILLGFCINNENCIWNNIIPYNFFSNNFYYNLIEKICDFIFKILYWKDILNKKYLFNNWIFICIKFIKTFFYKKYINKSIFLNKKNFLNIIDIYNIYKFNKYININIFKKMLIFFLKNKNKKKIYSINSINFCSFIYSESLFFKITCLIGMNENMYPKNKDFCDFNLININSRLGDRDKISYDKYLFLQKILFCDKLYISYINFCFLKNNFCFPSILLVYFKNYINIFLYKNFFSKLNKKKYIYLKRNIIFKKYNLNIFNYINKENYFKTYKKKYIISLNELHNFWSNPIKYFLFYFHKINYFISNIYISKNEYFDLDIKKIYFFRYKIIDIFIKYGYNKNIFLYLQNLNFLPLSYFGKILWEKEKKNIFYLISNIKKYYFKINKVFINVKFHNFYIKGYINQYNNLGLIKWLPKNLNLIDALLFWIDHLVYCYKGGINYSYLYGYNGIWCLKPINKYKCIYYINKYVNAYLNSYNYPLFFLPKSSNIWILSAYNINNKILLNENYIIKAKKKLFNILYGNFFIKGEINDIYISYIINKYYNFLNINFIINKIEKWLLPVFNNLIINNIKYY